jgi:transposase
MRGTFEDQGGLFSYISAERRVARNHPLRKIRELVREALKELSRSFSRLYAKEGRPSVPPEQLLSALLIQVFYGVRSERQLMEQLDYNLLYRWFVGLSPDDPVWDATTFTKNRERLQQGEVFERFMTKLLNHPEVRPLLSDEHFSVDGTLIEAWASHRSFRPKEGGDGDGSNFHGQTRKNDTHQSTSDPDSRLYRKAAGREAKLSYMGHATMENRHGLAVAGMVTLANGTAERRASEAMLKAKSKEVGHRITVGEDKAYDTSDHVLRAMNVTAHVTQNDTVTKTGKKRRSAIDERTTRHKGYGMSQSRRAMVECIFGCGQIARHHAQDQASRHRARRRRLPAQPDRLQSRPHSKTASGVGRSLSIGPMEQAK